MVGCRSSKMIRWRSRVGPAIIFPVFGIARRFRFSSALVTAALAASGVGAAQPSDPAGGRNGGPDVQAAFTSRDANADGSLTEAEFAAGGGQPADRTARDFRVFDADGDDRLSPAEFAGVPYWPEDQRAPLPDPVELLAQAKAAELDGLWGGWDRDGDGGLGAAEFVAATPGRRVPGLELTGPGDWDLDHDGQITPGEARRLVEVAFGVRVLTGEPLRSGGRVLDWRLFRGLDADGDREVPREDYLAAVRPPVEDPQGWFRSLDADGDDRLDLAEFGRTYHRTDPAAEFLGLDADLDGRLSPGELEALSVDRRPLAKYLIPGFDDDGDGGLSLREYQLTPVINLLTSWHVAVDANADGRLNLPEFQFASPPALAALAAEYFRRLDADANGDLGFHEWAFVIDPARAPAEVVFSHKDADGDRRLAFEELRSDLPRPNPGDRVDLAQEHALVVAEEAFLQADANGDRFLDLQEFSTDAGREAAVPGSSALSTKIDVAAAPILGPNGWGGMSARTCAVLAFNGLLVLAITAFLFRKSGRHR